MSAALLQQGVTAIRDALKTLITTIGLSDDTTAFADTATGINPNATGTSTHAEACTNTNVDYRTFDSTITVTGSTEFTNKVIYSIGVAKGLGVRSATGSGGTHTGGSVVGTDTISRAVRSLGIGVQSGDTMTLGVRTQVQDNS